MAVTNREITPIGRAAYNDAQEMVAGTKSFRELREIIDDMADGDLHSKHGRLIADLARDVHSLLASMVGAQKADFVIRESKNLDDLRKRILVATEHTPHKKERQVLIRNTKELVAIFSATIRRHAIHKAAPAPLDIVDPLEKESDEADADHVEKPNTKSVAKSKSKPKADKKAKNA